MALFELFVVFSAPIYLLFLYRSSDFNTIYYTLQMMDCSFRYVFSLWIGCSFSDELFQNDGFCLFVCDIKASFVDRQSEYHPARNLTAVTLAGLPSSAENRQFFLRAPTARACKVGGPIKKKLLINWQSIRDVRSKRKSKLMIIVL